MNRPLTRTERAKESRRRWLIDEEEKARSRGELGAMEFWLRVTRSEITKEVRAGRADVLAGFVLVCRLFMTVMQQRAVGDRRNWEGLLKYAQDVVDRTPPV